MMNENYKLNIETLTPVCIGSGTTLSPYSDFLLNKSEHKIYYINHELVKGALTKKPELIDEYVDGVSIGMDNTRSNFRVEDFYRNKLQLDIKKTALRTVNATSSGIKQLYTIIKNAGIHPYIPGSSIKGAIKTALLYDWLMQDDGQKWLKMFLTNFRDNEKRRAHEKELDMQFDRFQPEVSDSSLFGENILMVIDTKRLHLRTGVLTIPQTWETIIAHSKSSFSINCKVKENMENLDWNYIQKAVNHYTRDANDREWGMLEDLGDKIPIEKYDRLYDFYEIINKKVDEENKATAFMRVGSGKGYFFNSVGLAVHDFEDGKYFENFLRTYGQQKFKNPDHFPVTRPIDVETFMPLGWVRIENNN
jgi:CRISPR-associated protein Csm5